MMASKICIVDHDLASRGYLRECLEREGHQVITLDSGYQITPYLSEEPFNILILNMDSPGVKEKGLLLEIQKSCRTKNPSDRFRKGGPIPQRGHRCRRIWFYL